MELRPSKEGVCGSLHFPFVVRTGLAPGRVLAFAIGACGFPIIFPFLLAAPGFMPARTEVAGGLLLALRSDVAVFLTIETLLDTCSALI
jgi:hypothetical protein